MHTYAVKYKRDARAKRVPRFKVQTAENKTLKNTDLHEVAHLVARRPFLLLCSVFGGADRFFVLPIANIGMMLANRSKTHKAVDNAKAERSPTTEANQRRDVYRLRQNYCRRMTRHYERLMEILARTEKNALLKNQTLTIQSCGAFYAERIQFTCLTHKKQRFNRKLTLKGGTHNKLSKKALCIRALPGDMCAPLSASTLLLKAAS